MEQPKIPYGAIASVRLLNVSEPIYACAMVQYMEGDNELKDKFVCLEEAHEYLRYQEKRLKLRSKSRVVIQLDVTDVIRCNEPLSAQAIVAALTNATYVRSKQCPEFLALPRIRIVPSVHASNPNDE